MRGTAMLMKRSRNSYIRAPRSVTAQPIACPSRRLKFAIAFLARVTTGRWPVMAASSTGSWAPRGGAPGSGVAWSCVFFSVGSAIGYLTRWIGWPDFTATRSTVPSLSRRRRTRVGWPDFGSSSITFDAAIGAGNSMIPLSPWGVVARLCFFTTFTPSTTTRNCLGYTCSTLPSRPRSSPRITRTRSPLATWSLWRAGSRSLRRPRRLFLKTSGFISDHLRRERHDLHELLLAQLAPDRPEDAGRAGLALVGDEHRGVLVEADVGPVLALRLLGGPHDDGPHHLALLDLSGGDGVLDRDDDDVPQPAVATLGAPEHADHERAARARVVGDLDNRFLLDHDASALLRALDDLDHPPPLQFRQRPRLHDAHGVAQLRPPLVVGRDLLGAHDLLAVESVGEPSGQEDRDGLLPLVAHHDPGADLALAPRLLLGLRHAGFLSRSRRIVLMRAISRRSARNCSGFVIASVARLNVRRKRSSVRTTSFCCSSSLDSSRSAPGFCFAILALLPPYELGLDRQLGRGERQRQARLGLGDPLHLEHHATRLDHRDPSLRVALPLPHAGLGRLLGDGLVRKEPDPDLAAPLHLPRERHPRRLDLPVRDPARLQCHQPVVAERDRIASRRHPRGPALEPLAKLDAFRCQHGSHARRIGAAVQVLGALALEDPHLDPDGPVGRLRGGGGIVHVGAQGVQRHPPLVIAFGARDLRPAQPARGLDLDPLRSHPHRALHGALHGAPERDALRQLVRHAVPHQLGVELRPLDLLDVDPDFLARELRQLVAQLVHLGAPLADHDAGTARVDRHRHLARLALDVHVGDRRVRQPRPEVLPDQVVFLQELREVAAREVARAPLLHDPEPEPVGMRFLAHF